MWIIAVTLFVLGWVLQIVGHQAFEGKRPTAINNPVQSLIAPMYMVAKLYVAFGFRADLAGILQRSSAPQTFVGRGRGEPASVTHTLVTGGSGFIGQHLVPVLQARGRSVRVLDIHSPESAAGVQFVNGSILDPAAVSEALDDVDEVYHLAGLPGMWVPDKNDFHAVNCRGTEIVLAAARKRGVARFLHCSTESILFGPSNREPTVTENVRTTLEEMPGAYTRSKMQAEQLALAAAASGFPVVIANPTMPIGPHRNLTPPTAMLRYFLERRFQFYVDFVLNLVDVRDVAAGLLLVMERGQVGQRYILGGENVSLGKLLGMVSALSGRNALRIPLPADLPASPPRRWIWWPIA